MASLHTKSDTTLTDALTHALTDATFCSSLSYKIADTDTMFPEIGLDDIRGYDGGEYSPQEDRTAAYIENMKAEAA